MGFGKTIETFILSAIGIICVLIPVLSYLGILDNVQWIIAQKANFILLSVGLLLTYTVIASIKAEQDRKNNTEFIIGAIKLDALSELIHDHLQDLWNKREADIEAIFENVKASGADQGSLASVLEKIFNDMSAGRYFGNRMPLPWDITIGALDYNGAFIYHPSIPTKERLDHESIHNVLLKERNGTKIWENTLASEQFNRLFSGRASGNKRFTKIDLGAVTLISHARPLILLVKSIGWK